MHDPPRKPPALPVKAPGPTAQPWPFHFQVVLLGVVAMVLIALGLLAGISLKTPEANQQNALSPYEMSTSESLIGGKVVKRQMRTHRQTGKTEVFDERMGGWYEPGRPRGPVSTALPPYALASLRAEFRHQPPYVPPPRSRDIVKELQRDQVQEWHDVHRGDRFYLNLHNGSAYTVEKVTVQIRLEGPANAGEPPVNYDLTGSCPPNSDAQFSAPSGSFKPGTKRWTWRVVEAVGRPPWQ